MVALVDGVRDYSMKNDYVNILRIQSSPIRVGDSFDELKRKMIKYSIHTNMNNSSSGATEITNNDYIKQLESDFAIDANPSTNKNEENENNINNVDVQDRRHQSNPSTFAEEFINSVISNSMSDKVNPRS